MNRAHNQKNSGTVKWVNEKYGFVTDDAGMEYYFNIHDVIGKVRAKDQVCYDLVRATPKARAVRLEQQFRDNE